MEIYHKVVGLMNINFSKVCNGYKEPFSIQQFMFFFSINLKLSMITVWTNSTIYNNQKNSDLMQCFGRYKVQNNNLPTNSNSQHEQGRGLFKFKRLKNENHNCYRFV